MPAESPTAQHSFSSCPAGDSRPSIPQAALPPEPLEVHAWFVPLDVDWACLRALSDYLSPAEQARAARFHFERDRLRYRAAHGWLRRVLSAYVGMEPGHLTFRETAFGKPVLSFASALRFNMAHSQEWGLIGVAWGCEIGVDIEQLRPEYAGLDMAETCLAEAELAKLARTTDQERTSFFFRCWTRKEAFLKAIGTGLNLPLKQIEVSGEEDAREALRALDFDPESVQRWSLQGITAPAGYAAAVCVEHRNMRVHVMSMKALSRSGEQ